MSRFVKGRVVRIVGCIALLSLGILLIGMIQAEVPKLHVIETTTK